MSKQPDDRIEERSATATTLLQVCTTVATVALALGALLLNGDAQAGSRREFAAFLLLVAGFVATIGAARSTAALWVQAGMKWRDLLGLGGSWSAYPYTVLMLIGWTIVLVLAAYIVLIVDVLVAVRGSGRS